MSYIKASLNSEFDEPITRYISDIFQSRKVEVRTTLIPGCSFDGLFAAQDLQEGELICIYSGVCLRTKDALKVKDKSYLMRLGEQCYIDAKDCLDVYARYVVV